VEAWAAESGGRFLRVVPRFSCTNWKEHQGVQALPITIHPIDAENFTATTICAAAGAERAGCGRGWHRPGDPRANVEVRRRQQQQDQYLDPSLTC
jgi:hypothetical protein